jgi:hypothetical protein
MSHRESYLLLKQEGYLIHSCITQALTALRNARVDDRMGKFYTAFFQLSIGLERLMKTIIVVDHMANHNLVPPTSSTVRNHGHDLTGLFNTLRAISVASSSHPLDAVKVGSLEHDILTFLSEFARATRYFNLDSLSAPSSTNADPLARWNGIIKRILEEEVPKRQRDRIVRQSQALASVMSRVTFIFAHDLEKESLDVERMVLLCELHDLAARHAVYRVFKLLKPLRDLLGEVTDKALDVNQRLSSEPAVPYMREFLDFVSLDKASILKRKKWP